MVGGIWCAGVLAIVCELRCPFSCVLCVSFPLGARVGGIDANFSLLLSSWPRAGGTDTALPLLLSSWPKVDGIDAAPPPPPPALLLVPTSFVY